MKTLGIFAWIIWIAGLLWAYSAGFDAGQKEITPHACLSVCVEAFEAWGC